MEIITAEEIKGMTKKVTDQYGGDNYNYSYLTDPNADPIIQKLMRENLSNVYKRSYKISCCEFDKVIFLSDIHADLRKFIQILRSTNIAGVKKDTPILDPYKGDDIYNPIMISNVVFFPKKTLLVIIGDLVDGERSGEVVNDDRGNFEYLLLCFLHNLRISARKKNSEVLYTIGNHDYETIIRTPVLPTGRHMFDTYVTSNTHNFFRDSTKPFVNDYSNMNLRKDVLINFYKLSPFYMLSFMNSGKKEMACVHAGFHYKYDTGYFLDNTNELERFQHNIDLMPLTEKIPNLTDELADRPQGVIWTRSYADTKDGICEDLKKIPDRYPLIIVGHCTTIAADSLRAREILLTKKGYEGCDTGSDRTTKQYIGCVVSDCYSDQGAPQLIFVDTALSAAFRKDTDPINPSENNKRPAQVLILEHDPSLKQERYYNIISAESSEEDSDSVDYRRFYRADVVAVPVALPVAAAAPQVVAAASVPADGASNAAALPGSNAASAAGVPNPFNNTTNIIYGGFKSKYFKYKRKYLELKNKINDFADAPNHLEEQLSSDNFNQLGGAIHRLNFFRKYNLEEKSYSLKELSKISKISLSTLQKVYDRGIGAYKSNPRSVRMKRSFKKNVNAPYKMKLSKEQWAMARVYSFLDTFNGKLKHDTDLI